MCPQRMSLFFAVAPEEKFGRKHPHVRANRRPRDAASRTATFSFVS